MTAFATAGDVAAVLRRTFTPNEEEWVELLLDQSADYLRGVIGQHVYPERTVTFTAYSVAGRVDLPQSYVRDIVSVKVGEADVAFSRFEDTLTVSEPVVDVTYTYGASEAPEDLKGVNVAMVSSAVTLVENDLGVHLGGLSSIALDDFRVAFADGGDKSGHLTLPELTAQTLQATYGASSGTVNTQ